MSVTRQQGLTVRLTIACALVFGALLTSATGTATAAIKRSFEGNFNGSDAPGGPFASVMSAAVDSSGGPSNGDVYVADDNLFNGGSVIDKFKSDGTYAGVQITGGESPQGLFSFLSFTSFFNSGIAVDSSSGVNRGNVYVADVEHSVVDEFSESGHYLCQITGATTPSLSECDGAAGSKTPNGSLEPTGVAVSSSGNLYVADAAHDVIDEFGPSGDYVGQIVDSHVISPVSVALDADGNLYVANASLISEPSTYSVVKFSSTGSFMSVLDSSSPTSVAVDPVTGHVDVFEATSEPPAQIAEYDSVGGLLDRFGGGYFQQAALALAVGPTGRAYVGQFTFSEGAVSIFGPYLVVPTVTTASATNVQQTTATLNGNVDPDIAHGGGQVTECKFEYGTSASLYGRTIPCTPSVPYSVPQEVNADVNGLAPDTTYHFRLVAANANGSSEGEDEMFITRGPPAVDSQSATAVTTSAMVTAEINPFGYETVCRVQYVDEARFESSGYTNAESVPCASSLSAGFGDQGATATLLGLRIDTVYHYHFIVTNQAGTVTGIDRTFATFGIRSFVFGAFDENGAQYAQAGGHPYELVDSFMLNTTVDRFGKPNATDANVKDILTELPAGLIGNPEATPKCSPYNVAHADCSGASQVGVLAVFTSGVPTGTVSPIYNLVPPKGLAAQLGARFNGFVTVHIDAKVRTGGDYGVTTEVLNSSAGEGVIGAMVIVWGVPAEASHDNEPCPGEISTPGQRCGRFCPVPGKVNEEGPCSERGLRTPFLTDPTFCWGWLSTTMHVNSWQAPESFVQAGSEMPAVMGCDRLDFKPTVMVLPENDAADSPTGLRFDLHIPQNENPIGLAEADLKNAVVALPAGVAINPAAANGLVGCSPTQIELHGPEPAQCPDASKVGSVEIDTPFINHPLKGGVYIAQQGNAGSAQGANPFGSLLAMYIAVDDPQTGVVVKLAGKITLDPLTGQLTTTFNENPQLPFEDLKLEFFGGSHASLITPSACGSYGTTTSLTPWSAPESGPPATPSDVFQISAGPHGAACAPQGFAPSFTAGTIHSDAGGFSTFAVTLTRNDGEQRMSTVATKMPPGLVGMLATVPLCGEARADAGTCPSASQIGHVTVTAGAGPDPVALPEAGKPQDPVYLTGPYKGAPFGLSIVVPAEAGPFNLDEGGHPVVVRARIEVDQHTGQVSVLSDPMPSILQGIPVDVRTVNVAIDREGFIFNPTSCEPMTVNGVVTSTQGASANVSSRFQAADCRGLPFKPKFSVHTQAKTSKHNGASLHVTVQSGKGQANIGSVHVELPKLLPSRLSTLKQACPEATFNANPASCPAGSKVGGAKAYTPVLPVPLTGPAYFVSHGGAKFPELIVVLQGDGVTVDLAGETFISPKGITSSTFGSVPDVPITRFDLTLPTGASSALTANGNLCKNKSKLTMPTTIKGQNGAVIKQSTKIAVDGCPKAKKHRKK